MDVSVVIRCRNEEAHIGRLLTGLLRQGERPAEIILVDSGSTDATLAIASAFPVEVVHIAPEDFSFGAACNVGCRATTGDVVVFASAHVYPVFDDWLERLVAPLHDPAVELAYGRQVGPPGARFSEQRVFSSWFPAASTVRQDHPFCNNANAAIRRSAWEERPYDEALTGLEDLDWAKRALEAGGALSYAADATVVHVHHESTAQVVSRYRREAIAHRRIYGEHRMPLGDAMRLGVANVVSDLAAARRAGVLGSQAADVLRFRTAQFYGTYRGFGQDGPVTGALRQRFFYPDRSQGAGVGDAFARSARTIDYEEPLDVADQA